MFDLAIIGAGPAGMAAAETACECGMAVVIVDEQQQAGGQILRRPPTGFTIERWLPQRAYRHLHRLYQRFTNLGALEHLHSRTVLGISSGDDHFVIHSSGPSGFESLLASRVLIATGCFDMPLAFAGAQLPGVMSAGGLQAFFKSQRVIAGERFAFVGSHPLQLIVANQIASGGGDIAGVFFSRPLADCLTLLRRPLAVLRQLPNVFLLIGAVVQLLRRRVPIRFGVELVAATGDGTLESVQLNIGSGKRDTETVACDRLALCFGFLTNNDLARQAGVQCSWSSTSGGWIADHDEGMRSSVAGIYVAGETTGVAGAKVACLEGRLAALSAALDAGSIEKLAYSKASAAVFAPLAAARSFAGLLAELSYPGDGYLSQRMTESVYLCKCEEVTVGEATAVLAANPDVSDLSAMKLLTRCGMGHCQGRYCHYQCRVLLARERGLDAESLGGFTARFPVRPVTIGALLDRQHATGSGQ